MLKFFRNQLVTGLIILAPITITFYVLYKVFVSVDSLMEPFKHRYPIIDFPGIGVAAVLIILVLTGFLAGNLIGRRIIGLGERYLNRIPLIRGIYSTVKEISQVFLSDRKTVFRKVVLIRYPHPGSYSLAFITQDHHEYFASVVGKDLVIVFLPTSPNPTSGYLLLVPREDVIPVSVSVEEGLKMVISGGAVPPSLVSPGSSDTPSSG